MEHLKTSTTYFVHTADVQRCWAITGFLLANYLAEHVIYLFAIKTNHKLWIKC